MRAAIPSPTFPTSKTKTRTRRDAHEPEVCACVDVYTLYACAFHRRGGGTSSPRPSSTLTWTSTLTSPAPRACTGGVNDS
ncbi:hypothetical protein J6590_027107 [Homalodisca vitripennis]|nr:hypothetical protein J6590_027107 [Homalodisca vitripennis]